MKVTEQAKEKLQTIADPYRGYSMAERFMAQLILNNITEVVKPDTYVVWPDTGNYVIMDCCVPHVGEMGTDPYLLARNIPHGEGCFCTVQPERPIQVGPPKCSKCGHVYPATGSTCGNH